MSVSSSYFGLLCRTITLLGQKNLIIKSSCVNQIYYFWAIENILEFTCVTLYVPYVCIVYVYVTCVTYVMDNFIPNSVSIGFICLTFLHCAFSNVSSNRLPKKRHSHIGCIYLTFLHCAFSNVVSNRLPEKMHSRIGCICLTCLCHFAFSNVASNCLVEKRNSRIGCISLTFLHCASSNEFSNCLHHRIGGIITFAAFT